MEIGTTQQENPVTTTTRPARPEWDLPTREEQGELFFQEIRTLMEDGYSQVLTKDHAAKIVAMASKLLND